MALRVPGANGDLDPAGGSGGSRIIGRVPSAPDPAPPGRRRAVREILVYGLAGGFLTVLLKLIEARLLVLESSFEVYGALIALLFAGVGIWLGASLRRRRTEVVVERVPVPIGPRAPFAPDEERLRELGVTPRELEILEQIAAGLSNREIAETLFVSQNTVKTHASRLFEKLGAKRRTQAVQIGKENRLIP